MTNHRPVIQCDARGCESRFIGSYDILVLRDEARAAGWQGTLDSFPPSLSRPPDLCPACGPKKEPT